MAMQLLTRIEPDENAIHFFVAVLKNENGKRIDSREIRGTFQSVKDKLIKLNQEGFEIYYAVNKLLDAAKRKNENITKIRSCFVDSDNGSIKHFKLKPSIIVQSSRGEHAYWPVNSENNIDLFVKCQKGLITALKTDANIHDPARCMRLPGFYSYTNKSSPFLVTIKYISPHNFTLNEVFKAHPIDEVILKDLKGFSPKSESTSKANNLKLLTDEYILFDELRDGFVYHSGVIFKYTGNRYEPKSESYLKPSILKFLQAHYENHATGNMANQIYTQLTARGLINYDANPPCFLNDYNISPAIIPMENGLFKVDEYMKSKTSTFIPHTKDYFSLTCLPYKYDPLAKCSEFLRFLKRIQPDKKTRLLLQEWFGYNLIHMTRMEKMMLFVGNGANGKTVLCTILRELLGSDNVSSVPLEQFSSSKPYQLAESVGMLANIHEEFSGNNQISEGILKQFITGSSMTFERKMQRPFKAQPTARLTFCSNDLPQFKDRSSGLWRRLICVPFEVRIPASEQRSEYQDGNWWIKTGEMPGILNWALRGLARLLERGHFNEPERCKQFKKNYREDVNPTKTFLDNHCTVEIGSLVSTTKLYQEYKEFMFRMGEQKLSIPQFAEEIRRQFKVKKSINAISHESNRERVWINLKYRQ